MEEKPYYVANRFFNKMRYLVNGSHKWRIEDPIQFEKSMDGIWDKVREGKFTDFLPADEYVTVQQEIEGLPAPKYPLGSKNPLLEEKCNFGIRLIFMARGYCTECPKNFPCCVLCKKDLNFFDIGLYGD